MSRIQLLTPDRYKRLTWKNGRGHTDEIAIFPEGATLKRADFLWRVSSARIESDSPFSVFPEHDRVLVILKGDGVRLTHTMEGDEDSTELPPLAPYEFPGDIPSRCELIGGGVTDLSVFFRKGEVEALVETAAISEGEEYSWTPSGRWNFVFAANGSFGVSSELAPGSPVLEEGASLRLDLAEPLGEDQAIGLQSFGGAGTLVVISLQG